MDEGKVDDPNAKRERNYAIPELKFLTVMSLTAVPEHIVRVPYYFPLCMNRKRVSAWRDDRENWPSLYSTRSTPEYTTSPPPSPHRSVPETPRLRIPRRRRPDQPCMDL